MSPRFLIVVSILLGRQGTARAQGSCNEDAISCVSCLDNGCSWVGGSCVETCDDIADVATNGPCYDSNSFARPSSEICEILDTALCLSQNDCSTCTSAVQSDGNKTCYWYEDGFCGNEECGFSGCGVSSCPIPPSATCETCLDSGGVWVGGSCSGSCDETSNVTCYSADNFPGETSGRVCEIMRIDEKDSEICSIPTSCHTCTAVIKSDGNPCFWYDEIGICSSNECAMESCGSSFCTYSVSTCEECLGHDGAWAEGTCIGSCSDIAGVACHMSDDRTNSEICETMRSREADSTLCSLQSDCGACTATVKSDGNSTCYWYSEDSYCSSDACDILVDSETCGKSTCPSACESCVDGGGAWAVGDCLGSCSEIADAPCFSLDNFPGSTTLEICRAARTNEVDSALCSGKDECGTCTATVKSDGSDTCYWYAEAEYCASDACGATGCGSSSCDEVSKIGEENASAATSNWLGYTTVIFFVFIITLHVECHRDWLS